MTTPHYLRFARSLALLGGASLAACGGTTNTPDDAFTPPSADAFVADAPTLAIDAPGALIDAGSDAPTSSTDDAYVTPGEDAYVASTDDAYVAPNDAGPVADDAFDVCATCMCAGFLAEDAGTDAGLPACETTPGGFVCCAVIGPLYPPDLVV
ncbi:MAG: hypothetical protein J0L92_13830 [Deltaproteobacteria bacterium]|nr:hypothetical protein [Deltaproteobacteria bacterium]